jgi:hypothetical protein
VIQSGEGNSREVELDDRGHDRNALAGLGKGMRAPLKGFDIGQKTPGLRQQLSAIPAEGDRRPMRSNRRTPRSGSRSWICRDKAPTIHLLRDLSVPGRD